MTLTQFLRSAAFGACALVAFVSFASAADIYSGGGIKDDTPYIGWTGFYGGGNVGAAFQDTDDLALFTDEDAILAGGFHLGYNWQASSSFVFGLETDVTFLDIEEVEFLSSLRARLGFAKGPALAYLTGGAAFIEFDNAAISEDIEAGYVVGAGMEYKLQDNWSIGGEALYYGFDDVADLDANEDFFVARARLTYHMGYR